MSLVLESEGKIGDNVLKTPFFKLYESHLVIKFKDEIKIFHLDDVTNVRYTKKRNFTINVFLLFLILLAYCFISDFFNKDLLCDILLLAFTLVLSVVSFSIRYHTYILLINVNYLGFSKLNISKKQSLYAQDLVSILKTNVLKKNNKNPLDFVNFKYSFQQ